MRNKVIIQVAFLLLSISGFARISPSISAVSKQSSGILFTQTDNSTVYLPCQSVSAIVQSGGSSNTITVYYANEQSSIKTLAFDYTVTGFSTKQQAVDSLYEWSSCDTSGGGGVSQTLSISGDTLSISGGNSVNLNRKVDTSYIGLNATRDSLIFNNTINGTAYRYAVRDSTGGGSGSALSSITAATATNTINNANYGQEWQWNSLTSGTGLKLSSSSTSATNGNTVLEIANSGSIGTEQTTYGAKIGNTKVSSGTNYGLDINVGGGGSNIGLNITATSGIGRTGINLVAGMYEGIQMNDNTLYFSSTNTQYISQAAGDINFEAGTKQLYFRNTGTTGRWCWFGNTLSYNNYTTLNRHTSNGTMLIFGGEWDGTTTISNTATPSLIKASSGGLTFSSNSGASTTWGSFTPNNQMTIYNVNNNVGIGTTTPSASSKLEITSTNSFFTPPRMTSTQRDAVASPKAGDSLFCTDCTATDTTTGVMQTYNGSTWKNNW